MSKWTDSSGCVVSRRRFVAGLVALPAMSLGPANAAEDARPAVVDTPDNAAESADLLYSRGVRTIGRYYAREFQSRLPKKRLFANTLKGRPEAEILLERGFSILSVYQYENNKPEKFLRGENEAEADAKAALDQAEAVRQPGQSAIYFGVDFNVTKYLYDANGRLVRGPDRKPLPNTNIIDACTRYFTTLNRRLGGKFKVGVYGNGFISSHLRSQGLVEFIWLSASRAFEDTDRFYNEGRWNLFQNKVDLVWIEAPRACRTGVDIDTNIQNPRVADFGAWGGSRANTTRTQVIFDQRRFAIGSVPIYSAKSEQAPLVSYYACTRSNGSWRLKDPALKLPRSGNVRVLDADRDWLTVDTDEDGMANGFCLRANVTADFATMPLWDQPAPASPTVS
jgi:hypothetical protein